MEASGVTKGWPVYESRCELAFGSQIETVATRIEQRLIAHPTLVLCYVSAAVEEGYFFPGAKLLIRAKASPGDDPYSVQSELERIVEEAIPGAVKSWVHHALAVTEQVVVPTAQETGDLVSSTGGAVVGAVPKITLLVVAIAVLVFLVKFR